jgi:Flp pilus assembly protein CpaB
MFASLIARASIVAQRPLALAGALAALGVLLGHVYLARYERQIAGGERVPVLFVTRDVAGGQLLDRPALAVRMLPLAYVDERDVREQDLPNVVGIEAAFALHAQQRLQWTDLAVRPGSVQLSQLLAPGKRAVPLRISNKAGGGAQLVRPGDYIDLLSAREDDQGRVVVDVLLQHVLVLAVGDELEPAIDADGKREAQARSRSSGPQSLTVSLDLDEAQRAFAAASSSELTFALRPIGDELIHGGLRPNGDKAQPPPEADARAQSHLPTPIGKAY